VGWFRKELLEQYRSSRSGFSDRELRGSGVHGAAPGCSRTRPGGGRANRCGLSGGRPRQAAPASGRGMPVERFGRRFFSELDLPGVGLEVVVRAHRAGAGVPRSSSRPRAASRMRSSTSWVGSHEATVADASGSRVTASSTVARTSPGVRPPGAA